MNEKLKKKLKDIMITQPDCSIQRQCLYGEGCHLTKIYNTCQVFNSYIHMFPTHIDVLMDAHNEMLNERCCSMTSENGIRYCKDPMHFSEAIVCVNTSFNKDANGLSRCSLEGSLEVLE